MTTLNESLHAGSHIAWEANPMFTRETATVASGQNLKAGEVVMLSGGNLVALDGTLATDGSLTNTPAGVMFDGVDATDGAIADCVYTARGPAIVKAADITFPTETTAGGQKAATIAALKALNIIVR
jgi:hypothetical protein